MDELVGDERLDSRVLDCDEFFRILPGRGLKKTSKISSEKFGENEKVLTFAAAFRMERMF